MKSVSQSLLILLSFMCSGATGFAPQSARCYIEAVPSQDSMNLRYRSQPLVHVSRSIPLDISYEPTFADRLKSLGHKYLVLNEEKPFRTKAFSAAAVQGMGDFLSQVLMASISHSRFQWDIMRTVTFMAIGLVYKGPMLHVWYKVLGRVTIFAKTEMKFSKNGQSLSAMAVDQTVGVAIFYPLYYVVYELLSKLLLGQVPNLVALKAKMATTIIPIIFAQYYIWPLAQFISFKYCPAPLRVLYTNAIAVFWNCFMCSRLAA